MSRIYRLRYADDDDQEGANRQTQSLAGLAVVLALVIVCLYLVHLLHAKSVLEDCLMSGRTNCDAMVIRGHK